MDEVVRHGGFIGLPDPDTHRAGEYMPGVADAVVLHRVAYGGLGVTGRRTRDADLDAAAAEIMQIATGNTRIGH